MNLLMQVNASMNSIKVVKSEGWMYYTVICAHRLLNNKKGLQLRELMPDTRGSRCHDPLDKLYSVLGIASDIPNWLRVDHTKSIVEVYIDFIKCLMEAALAGDKLSFLGHCGAVLF
jgi:hypothetical protein